MGGASPSRSQYQPLPNDIAERSLSEVYPFHPYRPGDQFFRNIYTYHQNGGFWATLLTEVVWFIKFVFIVFVGIELTVCTRWEVLANHNQTINQWSDAFTPPNQCWASLPLLPSLLVTGSVIALLVQVVLCSLRLHRCWETRQFCTHVLHLPQTATELGDITWSDVQKRLITEMPYAGNINELVVYHRILRYENYLVTMINQSVLPVRFNLPFFVPPWSYAYLPDGYLFNIKLLLFWSPWSPFSQASRLRPEYKDPTREQELAAHLSKTSRILGLINLLFAPVILVAQALVFLCSNAQRIRLHPGSVLGRRWSNYALLYLRSVNELPHEFSTRIGLAYESASKYLDCFVSRNLVTLADAVAFILGSASAAFFIMGLIHEQMTHLAGYWAILVLGGLAARICLSYIPDDQVVQSPELLLRVVLSKIHHGDDQWIQNATSSRVYTEISHLFHYRLVGAIEDVLSPLITPFLLIFVFPNHTSEIVTFLRNYTVELKDLGDVCSLATLDLALHKDPDFQLFDYGAETGDHTTSEKRDTTSTLESRPVTGGKLEISLIAFHQNNPNCVLPNASRNYLQFFKKELMKELPTPVPVPGQDPSFVVGSQGQISPVRAFAHGVQMKNVSHLPGPGYINPETCGVVGALTESMKRSMHRSDPGVTYPTTTTSPSSHPLSKPIDSVAGGEGGAYTSGGHRSTEQSTQPLGTGQSIYQPAFASGAFNSGLFFTGQAYTPYTSQMENGSAQCWELASSMVSGQASRSGLTNLLTADTSASILWLQELAHRKRLQQSMNMSESQVRFPWRYGNTDSMDIPSAFSPPVPYQTPYTTGTSSSSNRFKPPGTFSASSQRFGYGSIGSTETVGIIRTSVESRRTHRPLVTEVVEEDDEATVTPRGTPKSFPLIRPTGASTPPPRSTVLSTAPTGVVTVSTSPSLRGPMIPRPTGTISEAEGIPEDAENTDPDHVWPDLPPTNC